MPKLTFSFSDQAGDIPTYDFTFEEINSSTFTFIDEQLDLCDDKVILMFESFKDCEYALEHQEFYITEHSLNASLYFYNILPLYERGKEEFNFNFFCFKTYEQAFKYCIDLKEGL
jgi:hypothetical protein